MGIFAGAYSGRGYNTIPEQKKREYEKRVEKLFQAGGMMKIKPNKLCGKTIYTIHKVTMGTKGMYFNYNYFEEDFWEEAGFEKKYYNVYSNKIGGYYFYRVIVAAYVLEEQYSDAPTVAIVNGDTVTEWCYIGWINYLFKEYYHVKNFDSWKLFEMYHDINGKQCKSEENFNFGNERYAFISNCEIYAVLYGTQKAIERYEKKTGEDTKERIAINSMKEFRILLKQYKDEREMSSENQVNELMDIIYSFYEDFKWDLHIKSMNDLLKNIIINMLFADAPAFFIKVIAELYDKDFWHLWGRIRNVAKRVLVKYYGNEDFYVLPLSTAEFLKISPDDMLYFWDEKSDLNFSKELYQWFEILKNKYYDILKNGDNILPKDYMDEPLKYVVDLMEEAEENYFRIFTFTEFLQETKDNIEDKRYLALWKVYEELLREPEMKEAGDVIFVPDGPDHEKEGVQYWGTRPKRRLINYWNYISDEKKNNKARVMLRRYMALVANKKLRYKIFGV